MKDNFEGNIYHHIISCAGLLIELCSNDLALLKLDYIKNKKINNSTLIPDPIERAISFLEDYFTGTRNRIEISFYKTGDPILKKNSGKLYLDMSEYTDKEIEIYRNLLNVKASKTISYSELSSISGITDGARFAGNCMAQNRFPVIIPCHRVIKKDGSMGNYTGGVDIKEFLLKHEENFK